MTTPGSLRGPADPRRRVRGASRRAFPAAGTLSDVREATRLPGRSERA